jgi:energy-coupling factor transport system ATP-binding protein
MSVPGSAVGKDIYEETDCQPPIGRAGEAEGSRPAGQPETVAVKVQGLEFVYPPPRQIVALQGIDLEIQAGDFVTICGQNGSGKTTLAKCVSGFLQPTRGEILVHGEHILKLPRPERAKRAGYVFQNPDHQLFKETVWEDVAFGPQNLHVQPREIETSVEEVLRLVELWDQRELHPFRLSKGDRQRLAFANIFILKPQVLIIDEPTTGQDPRRAREIMDMLARVNEQEGTTIVVITHAMELVAEYARRVIVLAQGNVLLDGTPRQIFSQSETLARTFLAPPPVVQLALDLSLTPLPLTVREAAGRILEAS